MTTFVDRLALNTNRTQTLNGAGSNSSTLSATLDFFSLGGALRGHPEEFVRLFHAAYKEDRQTALRTLFYFRDIRGGQGERDLFRLGLDVLQKMDVETYISVVKHVPDYGRWDDLFVDTILGAEVLWQIELQFKNDLINLHVGQPVSLLAKWLPSENASSRKSKKQARQIAEHLEISRREYRQHLSQLRRKIDILEAKMSSSDWEFVDYSKLPGQAFRKHTKAFRRNDSAKYSMFLEAVQSGDKTVNASTLYTYEIYEFLIDHYGLKFGADTASADAMWSSLPDWTNGSNSLVVADVSGSMIGRPMAVSVSLALYFAERNSGTFKDYFMTFSSVPQLVKVNGRTLSEKLLNIRRANWEMSTNLEAVFSAVLDAAHTQEDLPGVIYIISDMEFDHCVTGASETLFENASRRFSEKGLTLPHVVFWNVDGKTTQAPATKFDSRVTLISGLSQSTFRYAVEGKTPLELMDEVVNSDRYSRLVVA